MLERIDVLGTEFHNLMRAEAVDTAMTLMRERRGAYIVTPNPEIVMACRRDEEARVAVQKADLVIADGVGIIVGAKMLNTPLKEKIPGIELTHALLERLAEQGGSVFLLGAKPNIAEEAAEKLKNAFPGLVISGTRDGYFTEDEPVIEEINAASPDILLVCLGAPKQEKWMHRNASRLNVGLMIGNGGALDVFAGRVQRAPQKMCDMGLEWLYRLYKEPRRIGRMMRLPQFLLCVAGKKLKG